MKNQTLKLKQSGSLFNYLMANNQSIPEVGKGATRLMWSDRHAYEVMSVSEDGMRVTLQAYEPERVDPYGMSDSQEYKYEKLTGEKFDIIWRNNAWRYEHQDIVLNKEYQWDGATPVSFKDNPELWDENRNLKLIPGITRIQKTYPKINIIFGVRRHYFDYSF